MRTAVTIALFCAGGGLARYYLSGWIYSLLGRGFPWSTLAVNLIGAYFIGLIMELGQRSTLIPDVMRIGLTVGLLGGLTTFPPSVTRLTNCLKTASYCRPLSMCWPAWRSACC